MRQEANRQEQPPQEHALLLGIEALERIKTFRTGFVATRGDPLPGETTD